MPISLTCSCGARLEIDDKFAGQSIPCPDCSKPLLAEPPAPPPTRTSGLAVLSLLLALVGAFTVVGTLAAIACGAVAYKQLTRKRGPVGGVRLAQAGMILGAAFTVVALAAYGSHGLLGIDSLMRQYVWAGKLDFPSALLVTKKRSSDDATYTIERPSSAWGVGRSDAVKDAKPTDHLMLVQVRNDAHILWLSQRLPVDVENDKAGLRALARDWFRASTLLRAIGRIPENVSDSLNERGADDAAPVQEFFVDVTLSGIPRTFLFRLDRRGDYLNVLVGGARAHQFAAFEKSFRDAFDTFKPEEGR